MKIGVLSDTHISRVSELPPSVIRALEKADLIIHLGDFDSPQLLGELREMGDFIGVAGNHDGREIRNILSEKEILEVKGKRIGLIHGHGCVLPLGFQYGLLNQFKDDKVDAVLYGHTHIIKNYVAGNVLFFNPGSAAGRFPAFWKSFGMLDVNGSITAEIHHVVEKNRALLPRFAYSGMEWFASRRFVFHRMLP